MRGKLIMNRMIIKSVVLEIAGGLGIMSILAGLNSVVDVCTEKTGLFYRFFPQSFLIIGLAVFLGLMIWGGYTMYKELMKNMETKK